MIYYTADTHFGHANVVEMCERPYPDVDAMNEAMIAAWNERVHGNDTVYKKFRRSGSCDGIFLVWIYRL